MMPRLIHDHFDFSILRRLQSLLLMKTEEKPRHLSLLFVKTEESEESYHTDFEFRANELKLTFVAQQ